MARGPETVFFLSDYGLRDEFAGVVRAVLRRLAPQAVVIDLTHEVPPFDVAAGARTLERALPHLGEGVVLAVVDPGVGSARRAIALEAAAASGRFFVGPDNGLLMGAVDQVGGIRRVVALPTPDGPSAAATFDGRDVFAPAVAALCNGAALAELGPPLEPASLVRLAVSAATVGTLPDGRTVRWFEVTWVDRFGNAQLNAGPEASPATCILVRPSEASEPPDSRPRVRLVRAFAQLAEGEVGMLTDSSAHLALVVREGSAADALGLSVGETVGLADAVTPER